MDRANIPPMEAENNASSTQTKTMILSGHLRVQVVKGDITAEKVEAITNASNESLQHIGGISEAIVKHFGR
jgi:hypothetical protein